MGEAAIAALMRVDENGGGEVVMVWSAESAAVLVVARVDPSLTSDDLLVDSCFDVGDIPIVAVDVWFVVRVGDVAGEEFALLTWPSD